MIILGRLYPVSLNATMLDFKSKEFPKLDKKALPTLESRKLIEFETL